MPNETGGTFWGLNPLGEMTRPERGAFYDELDEDSPASHMFVGDRISHLYENPRLEIAILEPDGSVVPAQGYNHRPSIGNTTIDVFMERYFVAAMPGNNFDLQLAIMSRHRFEDHEDMARVAHSMAVRGVVGDYVNYLGEPVFRGLAIEDELSLDIAINFLSNRNTRLLLAAMDSDVLAKGVQLASVFNPAFGMIAEYARGVVKMCVNAKQNVSITDMHLTFTASGGVLSAPLIEGTYLLFQPTTKESKLDLADASYDMTRRSLLIAGEEVRRNHLILSVRETQ